MWKSKCGRASVEEQVWKSKCGRASVEQQVWNSKCGTAREPINKLLKHTVFNMKIRGRRIWRAAQNGGVEMV